MMSLTIGAWANKVPGTIGIGLEPGPAVDHIMDARHLIYEDGMIDEIYSYDMIEHLPTAEQPVLFKEWYRLLKSGGRLEISTVDLEATCRQFIDSDFATRKALIQHFYGSQSFESDFHKTGYDFAIIKDYLEKAGFINIQRCKAKYQWGSTLELEAYKP